MKCPPYEQKSLLYGGRKLLMFISTVELYAGQCPQSRALPEDEGPAPWVLPYTYVFERNELWNR
jgi:hypothetical protein